MIDAGRIFIIDYKLLHGLSNVEDYTEKNTTDRREMEESRSPFCTFVTTNVGGSKELKPVAIQTDLIKGELFLKLTRTGGFRFSPALVATVLRV
jgi:hypothetical protein